MPPIHVRERKQGCQVDVSLPGVKTEDIDLRVHQNTLTVKRHYRKQEHQYSVHQQLRGKNLVTCPPDRVTARDRYTCPPDGCYISAVKSSVTEY